MKSGGAGNGGTHHVMARGNRRGLILFEDGDQDTNRDLLAEQTCKTEEVCASCLVPDDVSQSPAASKIRR
jgi:hypothetical protein